MSQQAQAVVQAEQKTLAGHPQGMPLHRSILQRAAVIPAITPVHSGLLQRCSGGVECEECRQRRLEREGMMQRAAVSAAPVNSVPLIVHAVLSSPGQSLDAGARAFMEPRFNHDFSQVRVHTDAKAAESAQAVNALAYTVGRDVVFGRGQYMPETMEGMRLMAHELTHVVQQGGSVRPSHEMLQPAEQGGALERNAEIAAKELSTRPYGILPSGGVQQLQKADGQSHPAPPASPAPQPAPTYGPTCSQGANNPCQNSRCTHHDTIRGDISRAINYVSKAIIDLSEVPLAPETVRALDWYFNAHGQTVVSAVRQRLGCILTCLQDTQTNNRYGCHPDDNNLAYTCVPRSTPVCGHYLYNICFTDKHLGEGDRTRAEVVIHECAHRAGMSLGAPASVPDIYSFTSRFLFMDTNESLRNSDSFALFAGTMSEGIPVTVLATIGATAGAAFSQRGGTTWQAHLYISSEFQHPVLGFFNPTLGIGLTAIGETTSIGPVSVSSPQSLLASLLAGVRIANPRPGAGGSGYLSLFGGPALVLDPQTPARGSSRIGAEGGVALGFRWRWLDISTGVGYTYDPSRQAGMEHLLTLSAGLTFVPRE
jgi:hypothetical protein